jgi:putative membrane protein
LLGVTWWCHTIKAPWSWTPRAYVGVWLLIAAVAVTYALVLRRRGRSVGLTDGDRRACIWFGLGLLIFWIASDWPLATLGGAYLLSAHVVIYMLYTFGAAPLLLLGIRPWMARGALDRVHGWSVWRMATKPWVAAVQINVVLVLTHLPPVVDRLRASQPGSFLLDAAWIVSALVAWVPVAGPFHGDRIRQPLLTCAYLFLAFQLFPMLPGSLITFASSPVYSVYELAPRLGGWTPQNDQQLAGALMAIGCTPVVWGLIAVIFIRAAEASSRGGRTPPLPAVGVAAGGGQPPAQDAQVPVTVKWVGDATKP